MKINMLVFNLMIFLHIRIIISNPSCPVLKPNMINVHLISHSHDDLGWTKTFEQYYSDDRSFADMPVRSILTTSVDSLVRNSNRKFVYAESGYFFRWWKEQNDNTKLTVKNLLVNGQLEFIGGGWCQNDEATPSYIDIIDQMTLGLTRLSDTFGSIAVPRVAWQIDPFGHSKEQASLFAQMGMDGLIFSRIDYDDKKNRLKNKQMELVWKGSNYLGEDSWIFTGILPEGYYPPEGFCFDSHCGYPDLGPQNKDAKVSSFLAYVDWQKSGYMTSNLIMTMGGDFHYSEAESWFRNLDKLIEYVNELQFNGSKVNLVYSTPSCYLDALYAENLTWPSKTDDFFPYASNSRSYWTGYFTSRPTLKGFIRLSSSILQAVKQISALSGLERGPSIVTLAEAMGILLHHDATTGTAKQHVTDDYSRFLSEGITAASVGIANGLRILTGQYGIPSNDSNEFLLCPLLNISSCPYTEETPSFVVNVYNSIGRPKSHYVRIPVAEASGYTVTDAQGKSLQIQFVALPDPVVNIPGRVSAAKFELIFYAENIPALGVKQYMVNKIVGLLSVLSPPPYLSTNIKDIMFQRSIGVKKERLELKFDATTNKLKLIRVRTKDGLKEINVTQNWVVYGAGRSKPDYRASGAYLFISNGFASEISEKVNITAVYDGPLVSEVHQEWTPWVTQVIRLYKDKNYVEIEWLVGPIPMEELKDREISTRLDWGEMRTDSVFYTDANGREMQKRIKDYRETWNLSTATEPVSRNYYPVTSRLILHSTNGQGSVAIMNDRAQGGASLSEGEMELMVHRRFLYDDNAGVEEPLSETAFGTGLVARGRHFLLHSSFATPDCDFGCQHRTLGEELFQQPLLTFSSPSSFNNSNTAQKSGLVAPLPSNLRLLTLEPWTTTRTWLLRLENFYEGNESSLSGIVYFDIQNIFTDWAITDIREVTLGANIFKDEMVRRQWKSIPDNSGVSTERLPETSRDEGSPGVLSVFSFTPMEIRTFIIGVIHR